MSYIGKINNTSRNIVNMNIYVPYNIKSEYIKQQLTDVGWKIINQKT